MDTPKLKITKLKINTAAGILNLVTAALLFITAIVVALSTIQTWQMTMNLLTNPQIFITNPYVSNSAAAFGINGMNSRLSLILGLLWLLSLLPILATLALNIAGLIQSRKVGISIVGHVLGIVGAGSFWILPAFVDFAAPILLIIAGIFCLRQKMKNNTYVPPYSSNTW